MTKICSDCKTEKDIAYFNKNRKSKDGLHSRCKDCNRVQMRAYHQAHPEERKTYGRIYNQTHKEEMRTYRQENCGKMQAYQKKYKAQNREYLAQMERLRKQRLRVKQERKLKAEKNNTQLRLLNA